MRPRLTQLANGALSSLLELGGVVISMRAGLRAFDNIFVVQLWRSIKHVEVEVYAKRYTSIGKLVCDLPKSFAFWFGERPNKHTVQMVPESCFEPLLVEEVLADGFGGAEQRKRLFCLACQAYPPPQRRN